MPKGPQGEKRLADVGSITHALSRDTKPDTLQTNLNQVATAAPR
jgi:hypothetical protein